MTSNSDTKSHFLFMQLDIRGGNGSQSALIDEQTRNQLTRNQSVISHAEMSNTLHS